MTVTVRDPALAAVLEWFGAEGRDLPWRETRDTYAVWVAEVMSAQTTAGRAAAAWERWMARWPDVEALAAASLRDVLAQWQGLGYPRRARDMHRSARIIVTDGWPAELTTLPGVGPYVAAAIRCFAHEEPVLPVDVNVRRVLARRFPSGVDITGDPWRAGQALMELGQRVCSARPVCERCPVADGCPGRQAAIEDRRRGRGPQRAPSRARREPFAGSLRERRGRLLRRVIADGAVRLVGEELAVGAGLAADGLAVLDGEMLRAPE